MVTLTMVPDRFENRATAHLIAFKQRKQMMAGAKPVLADSGTLTCVVLSHVHATKKSVHGRSSQRLVGRSGKQQQTPYSDFVTDGLKSLMSSTERRIQACVQGQC